MTEAVTPRWREADEAVESLVATLVAAAAGTADRGVRKRPRGRTRTKRRPKSNRHHIAEVIRAHQLAPGLRVDRNTVAALLIGHRDLVSNPVLVVAVARACSIIAGRKLSAKKAARLRAASLRVAKLIARADADTHRVPVPRTEVAPPRRPAPVEVGPAEPTPPLAPAFAEAAGVPVPASIEPVPAPIDAAAAEPTPTELAPVEVAPVEIGPVEIGPVEIGPVEIGPVEIAPAGATRPSAGLASAGADPVVASRRRKPQDRRGPHTRRKPRADRRTHARRRRHARRWWLAAAVLALVVLALLTFG